jgi:exonuclease VII small subunit
MSFFFNVDKKAIRKVEDALEQVHSSLHEGIELTKREAMALEVEEKELVKLLENLYEDKPPQFYTRKGDPTSGRYIDPHGEE